MGLRRAVHRRIAFAAVVVSFIACLPGLTCAQGTRLSPHETITTVVDGATITITYGRPLMRGRKIFGALLQFDRLWMPGADEATLIKTDRDLMVGGIALAAGEYSLYTIPGRASWTLIINKQTGQFHTVYHQDQDLARLEMSVETLPEPVNQLTISAVPQSPGGGQVRIEWETTRAWVPFTVR